MRNRRTPGLLRNGGGAGLRLGAAIVAGVLVTACERERTDPGEALARPLVAFDTTRVRIETATDTFPLRVMLAEREDQRAIGLMERTDLDKDEGLLFLYPAPQDSSAAFWMYRTRIPLDIAFLDEEGRIVAILGMEPCESVYPQWCPTYSPGVPYISALEVVRGYFERRGIGIGDRVVRSTGDEVAR